MERSRPNQYLEFKEREEKKEKLANKIGKEMFAGSSMAQMIDRIRYNTPWLRVVASEPDKATVDAVSTHGLWQNREL